MITFEKCKLTEGRKLINSMEQFRDNSYFFKGLLQGSRRSVSDNVFFDDNRCHWSLSLPRIKILWIRNEDKNKSEKMLENLVGLMQRVSVRMMHTHSL